MSPKQASSFGRARPAQPAKPPKATAAIRVAAVQLASGPNVAANLNEAKRLIAMAVKQGAKLVALPEYFAIMGLQDTDKVKVREEEGRGPIQQFLSDTAKKHKIWIVGGSGAGAVSAGASAAVTVAGGAESGPLSGTGAATALGLAPHDVDILIFGLAPAAGGDLEISDSGFLMRW